MQAYIFYTWQYMFFPGPMVIWYIVCHVWLPYPIKYPYLINAQELSFGLLLGLPYPVKLSYPEIFIYSFNALIHKSACFLKQY